MQSVLGSQQAGLGDTGKRPCEVSRVIGGAAVAVVAVAAEAAVAGVVVAAGAAAAAAGAATAAGAAVAAVREGHSNPLCLVLVSTWCL